MPDEAVWARSAAPHTAVNSREKESKIYKNADGAVWARSPAPHTVVNSREKEDKAPILYGLERRQQQGKREQNIHGD